MTAEEADSKKPGQPRYDQRFGPEYRIRKQRDFLRVFARRCSVSDDQLIIYGCENELDLPRLAVSVSRKLGKPVFRNRWRRLIREVFRQRKPDIPAGIDYVVVPKKGIEPDFHELWDRIPALMKQLARRLRRFPAGKTSGTLGRPPKKPSSLQVPGRENGGATGQVPRSHQGSGQGTAASGLSEKRREAPTETAPGAPTECEGPARFVATPTGGFLGARLAGWARHSAENSHGGGLAWLVRQGLVLGRALDAVLARGLILAVLVYRWTISPLLGPCCRFQPSCSLYFIQAVQKYGAIRGACKGVWRILRCHPWHPGGYDPP